MVTTRVPALLDSRENPLLMSYTSEKGRPEIVSNKGGSVQVALKTGLKYWSGAVSEEYLTELKPWTKAVKVYQEMADDVVIGTLYESIFTPLMDSKFEIEPADDSQKALEAAEWVKSQTLENESLPWEDHVYDVLQMLPYGFSLFEIVLAKEENYLNLADLLPVAQNTVYKWGKLDSKGNPESVVQQLPFTSGQRTFLTAPMSKLLHFRFRANKRDPFGKPLSRALYRPWYFKKNIEVLEGIGVERDIGNLPIAELDENVFITDADETTLKQGMEALRNDDTAYIIAPAGVKLRPFGAGGKVYDAGSIIQRYQHLIRQRFFMDFVSLGSEGVGTQALAKEETGFFSLALGSIQKACLRIWNGTLIPYLYQWNPGMDPALRPKMLWHKPGKINVQSYAQTSVQLSGSGLVHWTNEDERHIREELEMLSITDEQIDKIENENRLQEKAMLSAQSGPSPAASKSGTTTGENRGTASNAQLTNRGG